MTKKPTVSSASLRTESAGGCFACSCRPGSIFSDLGSASLMELERVRQTGNYPAGAVVFQEDDQPLAVYCVCAGRVKLSCSSPDGRAIVLGVATSGEVLGVRPLLLGLPHDLAAETLEETRLCFIPKEDFLAFLARNGAVSLRLAQKLSTELGEVYGQAIRVALKPIAERVAELLLALCQARGEPAPGGIGLTSNMCQDELAEFIGVSRRSLSRALATLKSLGLIECRRRFIIVRDLATLRKSLSAGGPLSAVPSAPHRGKRRSRQLAQS